MDDNDTLAERFEGHRAHLRSVAYRILGSPNEADDAIQETWLRLHSTDSSSIDNLGGWLTTVVGRVCLDMLRSRTARREEPLDAHQADPLAGGEDGADPENEALLADSVGLALLAVLGTLTPAERLAFVLHDLFAVPFDEIAPILERTPAATRQLASRARRRVQGTSADGVPRTDLAHRRKVVDAFLAAARGGDFKALLAVLDPDVVLRADRAVPLLGTANELRGRPAVLDAFLGRAQDARTALVNGSVGAVWAPSGQVRGALRFTIATDRIVTIDVVADPEHIDQLDVVFLDA